MGILGSESQLLTMRARVIVTCLDELEEVAFAFDRIDVEDTLNSAIASDAWTGN